MSILVESNVSELSESSFSAKPMVWHAVVATAVLIAIVALIVAQPQPATIDYLAGIAIPF